MEPTAWPDERIDDAFAQLRGEVRDLRNEMRGEFREFRRELFQMKLFMLGGYVTILAAIVGLNA